jgi:acyl carrier protein
VPDHEEATAMNADDARTLVAEVLARIAPEVDLADIDPGEAMQPALDLDSIDFLNLMTGLHDRTGLEIAESDYPALATLHHLPHRAHLTDVAVAYPPRSDRIPMGNVSGPEERPKRSGRSCAGAERRYWTRGHVRDQGAPEAESAGG